MGTIPRSVTEAEFEFHIRPYLSQAKRGYVSKIPLVKVFNYILYQLYTGCQWAQLEAPQSEFNLLERDSAGMDDDWEDE